MSGLECFHEILGVEEGLVLQDLQVDHPRPGQGEEHNQCPGKTMHHQNGHVMCLLGRQVVEQRGQVIHPRPGQGQEHPGVLGQELWQPVHHHGF